MYTTKINKTKLINQKLLQPRKSSLVWFGYTVFIWSLLYMIPHLYWALGGTIGISMLKPSISELPEFKMINWIASVFLTAAGFLGIALIYLRRQLVIRSLLLSITLVGCSLSTSPGIYGIFYRIFQVIGVARLTSGPFNTNEQVYVLWDLFLFEPWFMIEGILLGIVGLCYLNEKRNKKIWITFCSVGIMVGIITGLLGIRFA